MALLSESKESVLTEAGNSVLTSSLFLGLLHITRHSTLTQLAQKAVIVSAKFGVEAG